MTDEPEIRGERRREPTPEAQAGQNVPVTSRPSEGTALSRPQPPVPAAGPEREDRLLFTPPIDIYESDEGLVLHADLPGVSLDTLELQVQDNKLTLFGRVKTVLPPDAQLVHQEYRVGDFLRSFILSDEVDHERISASLNNGVLKVVLPKAQKSAPRRIQVQTEG